MNGPLTEAEASRALRDFEPDWDAARTERLLGATEHLLRRQRRLSRRVQRVLVAGAACAALGAATVLGWHLVGPRSTPEQRAVETRSLELTRFTDGSTAQVVDTDGRLSVQKATEHEVTLLLTAGSADFDVTPNPQRAFTVLSGPVSVRAVGTQFRVERAGDRVRVAVNRGKVLVLWSRGRSALIGGESRWFPPEAATGAADTAATLLPIAP